MISRQPSVVIALGLGQVLAWGSTFYLPAILAPAMAGDLGVAKSTVFAAFSTALGLSALLGPSAGRAVDKRGGKPVLAATNVVFALGLWALSQVHTLPGLFLAWTVLGLGMGAGLYETAFAAVVRLYGQSARNAITGITLIAGFTSTVAWPLSQWLLDAHGWRGACEAWALLHLVLGLPLHLALAAGHTHSAPEMAPQPSADFNATNTPATARAHLARNTGLLAYAFAAAWFVASAYAAHLPIVLGLAGAATGLAVTAAALIGPAQVVGRLLEFSLQQRLSPLLTARVAAVTHPLGAGALVLLGTAGCLPFALLHGFGNGILTIAKGTLPLIFFGAQGYGARQGWLLMPSRITQALAPFAFGLLLDRMGLAAVWVSAALGVSVFVALACLRRP